ncbi:hypothetical protein ABDK00_005665 [Niabella insulamsoli]|uniref:hypothetical protein n=1 Tax=Niabella insulamsoli TaxID=3144874 RepID=UPI0031FC217D
MTTQLLLLAAAGLLLSFQIRAQHVTEDSLKRNSDLYETYITKAERKQKAAKTLKYVAIGAGAASATLFIIAEARQNENPDGFLEGLEEGVYAALFATVAVASGVTSVLLSASSKKYKKAALRLRPTLGFQRINHPLISNRLMAVKMIIDF